MTNPFNQTVIKMKTETPATDTPVIDEFVILMAKEDARFKGKRKTLEGVIAKLEKLGLYEKPRYRFPMKDTIGRGWWEELQKRKPI